MPHSAVKSAPEFTAAGDLDTVSEVYSFYFFALLSLICDNYTNKCMGKRMYQTEYYHDENGKMPFKVWLIGFQKKTNALPLRLISH